ncbi:membrane protein [Mycobacterium Phage Rosmarinus]|uniref:Membrane protein n=7 Tax=Anayavirus TaxID=2946797 RepID=A0A5J6TNH3_9CAUD|nr:membrane protein [Mycobacterium phage Beezoo]YP_009954310.1 membrane protein [Mycobacterium phage Zavala]AID59132.1 hypothetical protein PBI_EMERSON_33 [Mycobacterium phage Emerson]AOQ29091.1 hypothetical protein SEA_HEDWIGODU_33 [Mycobacterium phage HedwigODU]APU93137.1 hypothetical protein SEA_CREW_33 [Mycobacterium phage CREW]ASR86866.1 hypothetical protein SEA_JECKYLL_33 [Mycobacterium phage Jeckyll]ASR87546.1 hypothetical protein SEA_SLIMPHAZIE_33 [Mycobacterium phage Slimphazie]ASR8
MSMSDLMTGETVGMIAGSSVLSGAVGALLSRRRDNFKTLTDALIKRVTDLEGRVDTVESKLDAEQTAHEHTRRLLVQSEALLAAARAFIRTVMRWSAGDRAEPMPTPPDEVMAE